MKKCFFLFYAAHVLLPVMVNAGSPVYAMAVPGLKGDTTIVRFKVNGVLVKRKAYNISEDLSMTGVYMMGFASAGQAAKDGISIVVTGDTAGVYPVLPGNRGSLTKGISYGNYRKSGKDGTPDIYYFDSGHVTVVSYNKKSRLVSIRFSGIMKNKRGDVLEITEGELINGWVKPRDKNAIN